MKPHGNPAGLVGHSGESLTLPGTVLTIQFTSILNAASASDETRSPL